MLTGSLRCSYLVKANEDDRAKATVDNLLYGANHAAQHPNAVLQGFKTFNSGAYPGLA